MTKQANKALRVFLAFAVATSNIFAPFSATFAAQPEEAGKAQFSTQMTGMVLSGAYSIVGAQPTGSASFSNGNVGAYPEGSCVPALIEATNKKNSPNIAFEVVYDFHKNGNTTDAVGIMDLEAISTSLSGNPLTIVDNLNDFSFTGNALSTQTQSNGSAGTISTVITGPFGGESGSSAVSGDDILRHYNISLSDVPEDATAYVLLCARLGVDASEFPGSSLSVHTGGNGGGGSMPILGGELLQLPSLTINKTVNGGTATADQWPFNFFPALDGWASVNISTGQTSLTLPNLSVEGSYTITEGVGPEGYSFTSGTGTNCTFDGGTATISLFAAKPAINAVCSFTNTQDIVLPPFVATTGTITIIENVINDNGGSATAADFRLNLVASSTDVTFPGNPAGTTFVVPAGNYWTADIGLISGYTITPSSECSGNLSAGQNVTCTYTSDDNAVVVPPGATTGTLTVIKHVINDDKGTSFAGEFSLSLTASGTQMDFPGNEGGTLFILDAGDYSVAENTVTGYQTSYTEGCSGTLAAGETRFCTVTNDDDDAPFTATTGTLIVIKNVVNGYGGEMAPEDFDMQVSYPNGEGTTTKNFVGNSDGTYVTLDAGTTYTVSEQENSYQSSFSTDCTGEIKAGETKTCTVTNSQKTPGGGTFEATTGTVTIIKQVINDNGGTSQPLDFSLTLTSEHNSSPYVFPGNASGTTFILQAGTYNVTESEVAGYNVTYSEGCSGSIAANESRVCTVTNDDKSSDGTKGTLTVIKKVVGSTERPSNFILHVLYAPPLEEENYVTAALVSEETIRYGNEATFYGNENGYPVELNEGRYRVTENEALDYITTFSEDCAGSIRIGETKTCTVTNTLRTSGGGSNTTGGSGSGGPGWSPGILGGSPVTTPIMQPAGRVLAAEDADGAKCVLSEIEALYVTADVQTHLTHLGRVRDTAMEDRFNKILTPRIAPDSTPEAQLNAIRNFVNYGTKSNQRLGHGERAGAIDSFRAAFGHLPQDECDWQNVIKLANTKLPQELNPERETVVQATFRAVYGRLPVVSDIKDDIAQKIMAYGIRPQIRDLNAETTAISAFKKMFGKVPTNASEWDTNRALAYSGLALKLLSSNLMDAPSRMLAIMIDNSPIATR